MVQEESTSAPSASSSKSKALTAWEKRRQPGMPGVAKVVIKPKPEVEDDGSSSEEEPFINDDSSDDESAQGQQYSSEVAQKKRLSKKAPKDNRSDTSRRGSNSSSERKTPSENEDNGLLKEPMAGNDEVRLHVNNLPSLLFFRSRTNHVLEEKAFPRPPGAYRAGRRRGHFSFSFATLCENSYRGRR